MSISENEVRQQVMTVGMRVPKLEFGRPPTALEELKGLLTDGEHAFSLTGTDTTPKGFKGIYYDLVTYSEQLSLEEQSAKMLPTDCSLVLHQTNTQPPILERYELAYGQGLAIQVVPADLTSPDELSGAAAVLFRLAKEDTMQPFNQTSSSLIGHIVGYLATMLHVYGFYNSQQQNFFPYAPR